MAEPGLFDGVFARGGAGTGDQAWLTAMLQTEAALARALERAGLAPAGAGAAVTEAARAGAIDAAELGRQAALTGNPVPALVRALAASVPPAAAAAGLPLRAALLGDPGLRGRLDAAGITPANRPWTRPATSGRTVSSPTPPWPRTVPPGADPPHIGLPWRPWPRMRDDCRRDRREHRSPGRDGGRRRGGGAAARAHPRAG
jgi:hypothetical protein